VVKPKAQTRPPSGKKAEKPAAKQIEASEIAALMDEDDEPATSKPKLSAIDQSFVDLKEPPKVLKVAAADDMEDLLAQVLNAGPTEAPSSPQEPVTEPAPPLSEPGPLLNCNPFSEGFNAFDDDEPVANPFLD